MRRLSPTWLHADRPLGASRLGLVVAGGTVVDGDTVLRAADLDEAAGRAAGALRARGVERGDTVAWQGHNRWEVVVLYRACWRLGAVAAPIHHQAGPADVAAILGPLDPALVVDPDEVAGWVDGPDGPDGPDADDGGAGEPVAEADSPATGDDLAVVLHTSGSSGTPKGVLHTHAGLGYKTAVMHEVHRLTAEDAILMPAPLAHVSGLQNAVTVAGAVGMTSVLMARWDPEAALDLIERHRITFMIGPPTFFVSLRSAAGFSTERVATIRLISCGGAGVTPAFVADTAEAFGCTVKRTYGSTEAPTVTTSHAGDDRERARETDGRPTGPIRLRLGDADELWVRGPELFVGYTDPARTAEAVTADEHGDEWFRTGDAARIDPDGWLTIVGRIKDLIIRGGENISAAEVESHLEAHPDVRQAVAVGRPDERLGERVLAYLVCDPGRPVDLAAVQAWFADRGVARFKTPELVEVLDELPTLAAGKIDRAALRRLART